MIQSDTMKTSSTVPGQIVIKVFRTNRVLKLIRLRAPIEREDASVNNFECRSITLWLVKQGVSDQLGFISDGKSRAQWVRRDK